MSIKINKLEIENVKRVKAVKIEPSSSGLTLLGGKNNQGKTSVLDSIAWVLGGNRYQPSEAQRTGSITPPAISMTLSNGLVVERKGKNATLKVTDPAGQKGGQNLLDSFVEQLALDLPKFMAASPKDKAQILLKIIGVGPQLAELERKEQQIYNERTAIGKIADQKKKFADEMTYHTDAPKDLISASDLIKQQQDILARNGENQRKRENLASLEKQASDIANQIAALQVRLDAVNIDLVTARKSALDLLDESTTQLEANITNIEEINRKVRQNLDKEKAEDDANYHAREYAALTTSLEGIRKAKTALLDGADLPLPGLAVQDGELTYQGHKWDSMSGSDQLKVSVAIVRKLKPECGFVLMDKFEAFDLDALSDFGAWLESEGLQVIATRVSTGPECSIIIDDGYVVNDQFAQPETNTWEEGKF